MIASTIGKTFLKEYNRRQKTDYSAEKFFEYVMHPLFYDHEKYMQWITNSPFVQGLKKGKFPSETDRKERFQALKEKIEQTEPDLSIAVGYPSTDVLATTSGQLTDLSLPLDKEDTYASWIGGGLGVGVSGGYSIYFDDPSLLHDIFTGWQYYRKLLEEMDALKGNQIETWNGEWLAYYYSSDYDDINPASGMNEFIKTNKDGLAEVQTQRWSEVLMGIAQHRSDAHLMGYVFSIGNTNKTIGFIPFHLPQISMPLKFYKEIFGENEFLQERKKIRSLYGTAFSFIRACQKGMIGVPALEPKDLRKYMNEGTKNSKMPDYTKTDHDTNISFKTYQTWLLAMTNNKELWSKANEAAKAYLAYEQEARKGKTVTTPENQVKKVLNAPSKRKFIEANIPLVEGQRETAENISTLVEEVHGIPEDNFKYFITLLKFRYSYCKHQKQ